MIEKTPGALTELVANRVEEGQFVEFKSALPGRADKGKHEFLKDVTALANAEGGQILFGIREEMGAAAGISALVVDDKDGESRRLLQMLDSQVEPRLRGVSLNWLTHEDGDILILNVPKSYYGPHRFLANGNSKFVLRNHAHVIEMTYDQIADAMVGRDRADRYLEAQWREWLDHLNKDMTFRPVSQLPALSVGLMPVIASRKTQVVDLEAIYPRASALMDGPRWGGCSTRFNFEGLAVYPGNRDERLEHLVQISRFGSLLSFDVVGWEYQAENVIPSIGLSQLIADTVRRLVPFAKQLGIAGEWILKGGVFGIGDHKFVWRDGYSFSENVKFPRDSLEFPDLLVPDIASQNSDDSFVRPWLDILWQAHGRSKCSLYADDGALRRH